MNNFNLLKPDKENLKTFILLGSFFIILSFLDILGSTFLEINITGFLPSGISYFSPLMIGFFGLYLIRIEYSGNRSLDKINKSLNSNNFNAILTLIITFVLIKYIPPILNWFIFDADFAGATKQDCTSGGACWVFVKVWMKRFMYGMYPDAEQWRINLSFIALALLGSVGYFATDRFKKYLISK